MEPLAGEDAAWLHAEDATNPMVIEVLLELDERLPMTRATALAQRLAQDPRFHSRLVEPRLHVGRPCWDPVASFDASEHVEHVTLGSSDEAELRGFVSSVASHALDRERPLWRVYVVDRPGRGTALLFRVHHALADGFALLGLLAGLADDTRPAAGGAGRPSVDFSRAPLAALRRLVLLPPDAETSLKHALGGVERVAWSEPLSLADVKDAAHRLSATVNDVLVAVAAGALGRWLESRSERANAPILRAMVPVDLRGQSAHAGGNHFGLVIADLPVGVTDPIARVEQVHAQMQVLANTPEASVAEVLLSAVGRAPPAVERVVTTFFGKKTSLVLTNVRGPSQPVILAGIRVRRMIFWVPSAARLGLGISIFSYAGEITLGVRADAAVMADPEVLVAEIHAEMAALEARLRERASRGVGPDVAHA